MSVVCHAPGDTCLNCDHYQGKADKCAYAAEWTTTPPTEPGWYWHKWFKDSVPYPRTVTDLFEPAFDGEWWPIRIEEPK